MSKYKFDIRIGHYVLNEDAADGSAEASAGEAKGETSKIINLETPEIVQKRLDMKVKLDLLDKDMQMKEKNIIQIQDKLADLQQSKDVNQSKLNQQQKLLLQALQDLDNKQYEREKKRNEFMKQIFAMQLKLIESREAKLEIPAKYKYLNESNIQNAKIHINKLINDDIQQRIKGMVDFKKVFGSSELLYGKDKDGYFAVCVDQEDFSKLTDTLEEAGYLRDAILACVMPQLFDRSNLTK